MDELLPIIERPEYKKYKCKYFKICGNWVERINAPSWKGFSCYSCKLEHDKLTTKKENDKIKK